ncbi:hypothetical protein MPTK1_5g06370 [Marchantia polymorpha subsp. ruderalis]|uniref:Uncharacterized protein n=2 Tax=Marchantia polymorpha TaxID=3197 RepID=A0A176VYI2_MARPO|nr:hypothetical protein AXG93_2818s1310 [Marchantia polymorpha subsp. ruderalis]PTQ27644.1 hypothetical protein MARPO_0189s0017 [Marchantia polymorpha]PTQ27645.1 hypothetical protein MARPO_0189s0017 [Marchantia polymorpha]BBN10779.1 hypothetical protein Mp_5g06370 [Marchantia polymorpha subsp. ruderalis]BBN10780.1 hypothetical protein Mp_5g06370 [Marchantia polymorpha subsp. ruderalis]|eukprot:PTQ27644.1 hypothetical protein MARPO_0189s0017 [Marchantia polymorpha]
MAANGYSATTPATKTTGRRFGRKKKSGTSALVHNKMNEPGMKMVEMRTRSNERWGIMRAKISEKFSHWGAAMSLGCFTATHPVHPMRRQAAKELMVHKKQAATERRVQKEGAVHSIAAAKRARAREARVKQLNEAVHPNAVHNP